MNRSANDDEDPFLGKVALKRLTGKSFKSCQIQELRNQGIPFRVNSKGHPLVLKSYIEGNKSAQKEAKQAWVPRVLKHA